MTTPAIRIAVTPGEPAGIGPDLCLLLAQQPQDMELVVICDPQLLEERAVRMGLACSYRRFDPGSAPRGTRAGEMRILPVALRAPVECGRLDSANAAYVLETLDRAIDGCLQETFAALVTGPVHKATINDAGITFSGHTEYLAAATHTDDVVMMLATDDLRVALVTTHAPLSQISALITRDRLRRVIRVLHAALQTRFGIASPHIKVCGLNPHAGEGGHLGHEEIDTLIPVLQQLRAEGLDLDGPVPADTVFTPANIARSDAILAMYHDQGLPVLKHTGFGRAVNITLGLPMIRTSFDHGTALELAGTGHVDTGSLQQALKLAQLMVQHSGHNV